MKDLGLRAGGLKALPSSVDEGPKSLLGWSI